MRRPPSFFSIFVYCFLVFSVHAKDKVDSGEDLEAVVESQGQGLATLTNQVTEMVDQFQTMNGDIARNLKKLADQDKQINGFELRLQVLEDKIILLTGQLQELKAEGLLKAQAGQRFNEFREFSKAVTFVNAQSYDKAIAALTAFKKANSKSLYNSYAQYWIGESYYMQNDYPMAIKQFQQLISNHPRSAKVPTALYRQGLSFTHLQSFDDAKAFFNKLIRSYPGSVEASQASAQIDRIDNILALRKQEEYEMKMVE